VTPGEGAASTRATRVSRGRGFSRTAAIIAVLLIAVAIVVLLLSSGGNSNQYKLVFETGGQLVKGNQVLIGGAPVGSVDDVKLIDNGQAEVDISVDRPLHEGTSAIIRATSLSGVANRYVSIQPGPDNAPELKNDTTITEVDTTTPVDLDQLFNTLRGPERQALRNIIQGSSTVYAGKGPEANQTYKYLSPSLVATDRLFSELNRDSSVLTNFLVSGADVVSAVAERRNDLSALTQNANQALGAIAAQNRSFDQALIALPPALRQANTTFHNLRPALDDLDLLVNAAKPATKNLAPFLRQLHPLLKRGVPVFRDLNRALNLKGKQNDLADATGYLPALEKRAADAIPVTVAAMQSSEDNLAFLRPYIPDLMAGIAHLNQVTGYYDADGHYGRVTPGGLGVFGLNPAGANNFTFNAQSASDVLCDYSGQAPGGGVGGCDGPFNPPNFQVFGRCPGGSSPTLPNSNPFASPSPAGVFLGPPNGAPASTSDCNSAQVVPGP
jgi:phospholipid/cholesterol/gamma-HCH transport system substrate-binding protein